MKLKYKDIPAVKQELLVIQDWTCPICLRDLDKLKSRDLCLDHNHVNGKVRAVLCRSCNAIEGKLYKAFIRYGLRKASINYVKFAYALADYITYPETDYIHPKHKEKKK